MCLFLGIQFADETVESYRSGLWSADAAEQCWFDECSQEELFPITEPFTIKVNTKESGHFLPFSRGRISAPFPSQNSHVFPNTMSVFPY